MSTSLLSVLMFLSGCGDLLRLQSFVQDLHRLGYPEYLLTLLGIAKLLGALVLVYPGAPRLKEWTYAGFSFNLGGATISHLISGSSIDHILPPAFCGLLVLISYVAHRVRARET